MFIIQDFTTGEFISIACCLLCLEVHIYSSCEMLHSEINSIVVNQERDYTNLSHGKM